LEISPPYVDVPGNQLLLDETNENAHLALVFGFFTCICFLPTGFLALMFAREVNMFYCHLYWTSNPW